MVSFTVILLLGHATMPGEEIANLGFISHGPDASSELSSFTVGPRQRYAFLGASDLPVKASSGASNVAKAIVWFFDVFRAAADSALGRGTSGPGSALEFQPGQELEVAAALEGFKFRLKWL